MKWQTKLMTLAVVVVVGLYAWGYFVVRSSRYIWAKAARSAGVPEPRQDGAMEVVFKPMDWVEKLTRDTPVDVEKWVNQLEKNANPEGPAVSEEEIGQRFRDAHQQGSMEKIRALFYKRNLYDDDARQIKRFFDFNILSVDYADLPRERIAHSKFEDDLVVTRMMVVHYGSQQTLLPSTARYYIGRKDRRTFMVLRYLPD